MAFKKVFPMSRRCLGVGLFILSLLSVLAIGCPAHAGDDAGRSATGADCSNPIPIALPAALPYSDNGTTCGMVNDFDDPCIGPHGDGEEVVYVVTVTEAIACAEFTLSSSTGFMSMTLSDACGEPGNCVAANAEFGGRPQLSMQASLAPGTYYLVIDSWSKFVSCLPSYALNVSECVPEVWACCLDGVCLGDMTEIDCASQSGLWLPGATCEEPNSCPPVCEDDAIFSQSVVPGPFAFTYGTSDQNAPSPYLRYEKYSVNEDICALTWWGVSFDEPPCFEPNMEFQVTFYEDDGGMPGAAVCTYTATPDVIEFFGVPAHDYAGQFLKQWDYELPGCCTLHDGWISIQGTSLGAPDCQFGWLSSDVGNDMSSLFFNGVSIVPQPFDLSLCLHGGPDNCLGDIADGNNAIDVFDLLMLLSNWGTDGPGAGIAPPNDVVDVFDLLALLDAWGDC